MTSPYSNLPDRAFWRSAVGGRAPLEPGDVYAPRFKIGNTTRIVTAGSCFAQHVGRALRSAGFNVVDTEPAPKSMSPALAKRFGFGLYSARYGNVYTTRQLLQLLDEAEGRLPPAEPVWEKQGRFFDAFRPGVEPEGLTSPELVALHRADHLRAVNAAFDQADLFVFTFGLTEAWIHTDTGTVYPTAPGTLAGCFDPSVFSFVNYRHAQVLDDFLQFRDRMMARRPDIRFLVTVSPVPLTATASGQHVEVATAYSKSVLRAVCGELCERFDNIDYFPSFEIITSQNARGVYYEANLRNVSMMGVNAAMRTFLAAHGSAATKSADNADTVAATAERRAARKRQLKNRAKRALQAGEPASATNGADAAQDVVCEEAILEAFQK